MNKTELKTGSKSAENVKHFVACPGSHPPNPGGFALLDMAQPNFSVATLISPFWTFHPVMLEEANLYSACTVTITKVWLCIIAILIMHHANCHTQMAFFASLVGETRDGPKNITLPLIIFSYKDLKQKSCGPL